MKRMICVLAVICLAAAVPCIHTAFSADRGANPSALLQDYASAGGLGQALMQKIRQIASGEKEKMYHIDFGGKEYNFTGAKAAYAAGEAVELHMEEWATDTDYTFILEGADLKVTWENEHYVLRFTMPERDVALRVEMHNSMEPEFPVEEEVEIYQLPETEEDFGSGLTALTASVHTCSPDCETEYGFDRRDYCVNDGDVIPLGGPGLLRITIEETDSGPWAFTTNFPLIPEEEYLAGEREGKTRFVLGTTGEFLVDPGSGDPLCVYQILELAEY